MPISRRAKAAEAGFTLAELMVVIAIAGVLAALSMNYGKADKRGQSVKSFTEQVAALFEVASQRAIATQKRQRLIIDTDSVSHWESTVTGLRPPPVGGWGFIYEVFPTQSATIAATDNRMHLDANDGVPGVGTGLPLEIDLLPDGRGRTAVAASFYDGGWTVFFEDSEGNRARALLFGTTGTVTTYDGW